ncbi:MAG: UDP-2,3-diacylglucosamine diphosphatase LpxI [bacterium]|nr:UDP-2,3-diacylglucosamine diphosphatase LpxI [bacterium]
MGTILKQIGLVAGAGKLPREFLLRAREKGHEVAVVALSSQVEGYLKDSASTITRLSPAQPKKGLRFFQDQGVRQICFAGKVEKRMLFQNPKFDLEALKFIRNARNTSDVTIMDAVMEFFTKNGMEIIPQTEFLDHLLTPAGTLGVHAILPAQKNDAFIAFRTAMEMTRLDIGQTVVVRRGTVVAVEAVEGTDEAIRRGCKLAGKGAVISKVARPRQDSRYDIPTVGPETIRAMRKGGAAALILEAGQTFLLDKEATLAEADKAGIALVGWKEAPEE